jgi:hypothetical protein
MGKFFRILAIIVLIVVSACTNLPHKSFAAFCDQGLCLVHRELVTDTDGDGFSDDDEKALGTDPFDPASHPGIKDIITSLATRDLGSFNSGFSEIVTLPDKDPKGNALLPPGLVGTRQDLLKSLGLNTDRLSSYGMSDTSGFVIAINKAGAKQPPAHGKSDGPPGLDMLALSRGLYASGAEVDTKTTKDENKCDTSGTCSNTKTNLTTVTYTDDKGKVTDTVKHETTTTTRDGKEEPVKHATCSGPPDCIPKANKRCADNESCDEDAVFNQPKIVPVSRETTRAIEAKLGERIRPINGDPPEPINDGGPVVDLHRGPLDPTIILTDPDLTEGNVKLPQIIVISTGFNNPKLWNTNFGRGGLPESIVSGSGGGSGAPDRGGGGGGGTRNPTDG